VAANVRLQRVQVALHQRNKRATALTASNVSHGGGSHIYLRCPTNLGDVKETNECVMAHLA